MTPYHHAVSSAKKFGGTPDDYIEIHDWFDETKQYCGSWQHRALRHHAAGIQWAIGIFGHKVINSEGRAIAVKLIAEQHVTEDCGYIPSVEDWVKKIDPDDWMLRVGKKSRQLDMEVSNG